MHGQQACGLKNQAFDQALLLQFDQVARFPRYRLKNQAFDQALLRAAPGPGMQFELVRLKNQAFDQALLLAGRGSPHLNASGSQKSSL